MLSYKKQNWSETFGKQLCHKSVYFFKFGRAIVFNLKLISRYIAHKKYIMCNHSFWNVQISSKQNSGRPLCWRLLCDIISDRALLSDHICAYFYHLAMILHKARMLLLCHISNNNCLQTFFENNSTAKGRLSRTLCVKNLLCMIEWCIHLLNLYACGRS